MLITKGNKLRSIFLFGVIALAHCTRDATDLINDQKPGSPATATGVVGSGSGTGGTGNTTGSGGGTTVTVINVTSPLADGSYAASGSVSIDIQITFSAIVFVTGAPRITIATGSPPAKIASYVSGSGTNTLTFNFTTTAGMSSADLEYTATSALTLNGGTVKDSGTIDATLTLPALAGPGSLSFNKAIVLF